MSISNNQTPPEGLSLPRKTNSRLRTFTLCERLFVEAPSLGDIVYALPLIVEDGCQLVDVHGEVYLEDENSQNLLASVVLQTSFDAVTFTKVADVVAYPGAFVSYNTGLNAERLKFGRYLRFALYVKSTTLNTAVSGRATVRVTLQYFGQ